jgi:hypothetical protein
MDNPSPPRFVLRNLPLPAKLVLSLFLLSVGLGYCSAMVQLHFRHGGNGEPLPTPEQVVRTFHGDPKDTQSRLERILSGDRENNFGKQNMTPAFFGKSGSKWDQEKDKPGELDRRDGERKAVIAWARAGGLRSQFERFPIPKDWGDQPITEKYRDKETNAIKVQSIISGRCKHCHEEGGEASTYSFEKFEDFAKYAKPGGPAMSLDGLTQSTHAHLLSFAVLYACTGLIFVFSSYPTWLKVLVGPLALLAQVVDISCWWLARIPGPFGEWCALTIIGTGMVVGVALGLQILLSLFNMYGWTGKVVLLALFLAVGGVGGYFVYDKVVGPYLAVEKAEADALRKAQEKEEAKRKEEEEKRKKEEEDQRKQEEADKKAPKDK